jgi:hypothetical protein
MTASPAVDDRDKTARETVDTVCYWQTIPKPRAVLQEDLGKLKVHTVAGRAGRLRDDRPRVLLRLGIGGQGVPSRRPPRGLPRGAPGASLGSSACGWKECCPRDTAWSGGARPTGHHTDPSVQDRTHGPSSGRRTSRSIEKTWRSSANVPPVRPLTRRRAQSSSWPCGFDTRRPHGLSPVACGRFTLGCRRFVPPRTVDHARGCGLLHPCGKYQRAGRPTLLVVHRWS